MPAAVIAPKISGLVPAINPLDNLDREKGPAIHHCGLGCKICKPN